jgi:hypothetical protein
MNDITLKKNGRILCGETPVTGDPLRYLGCRVFLDEGFSPRSFFEVFRRYPDLKRLNAFFPEASKDPPQQSQKERKDHGVDFLELTKTVEMIGFPGPPKLDIYVSFTGHHKSGRVDLKLYGLSELLDVPLRLGKLKHIVFGDSMDQFEFEAVFTFFEFVDGILWELGFQTGSRSCDIRRP